ncbi:preprotein translocase subunit SecA [Patescibacteria group bacterium]|nr:preprotein translocase subunit SecA [Patescibacteria group bacterium]
MSFLSKIFGDSNKKELKKFQLLVDKINSLEPEFEKLNNKELKAKTEELKKALTQDKSKEDILSQAFALVRRAAQITLNQRHFDVQLIGGMVLHQGKIAEMRTGEGKTLAATSPVYLNALDGKGVHVITVNDYLSKRDCVWMGQIYYALGLSISCIVHDAAFIYDPEYIQENQNVKIKNQNDNVKIKNGERDKERDEFGGFKVVEDYLRPCNRKDAYRCDITYGTNNEFGFDYLRDNLVHNSNDIVQRELNYVIVDEVDSILIDEARTPLIISAPAEESADLYYKLSQIVKNLKSGEDYVIDEKTRSVSFSQTGKEGFKGTMIDLKGPEKIIEALGEDPWENNNLTLIHHIDAALKAKTLFLKDRDYVIKDGEIIIIDEFTGRLMIGRRYSDGLHQAIEAKENVEVKQESTTMATITFQNYFRFYKKLAGMTGTALTEAEEFHKIYDLEVVVVPTNKPMIRRDMIDKIYQTKEGKFKAIVKEIKECNEKGQPILVGTGGFTIGEQTIGAIEKNRIIKNFLEKEGINCQVLDATNHEKEGQIIAQAGKLGAVTVATNMAGRGVDIVLGGNPTDKEEQKKILELGGLHIIGTERHEARRIDNQLRGRSGRQGDPGSSHFFICLEDDLMRIFGGSRLAPIMKGLKVPEDMPIESKVVSHSIEAAQRKIEGFNFDTRKHLLEYDDVLNKHREKIYQRRRKALEMDLKELNQEILRMIEEEIKKIVSFHTANEDKYKWEIKEIVKTIKNIFPVVQDLEQELKDICKSSQGKALKEQIIKYLTELAIEAYNQVQEKVEETKKDWNDPEVNKSSLMEKLAKSILLQSIDRYWVYHLEVINNLKGGIGLRAYAQQDPLVAYKKESFEKFNKLTQAINQQVVYSIYKIGLIRTIPRQPKRNIELSGASKTSQENRIINRPKGTKKPGRNDQCPCGSEKKYKKCCYPKYG